MMLDSDILEEAWIGIRIDFPFFSERYKVVILREMGYALKKAREDERQRIRESVEEWTSDYAVDWEGIECGLGENPCYYRPGCLVCMLRVLLWSVWRRLR